jgi:hypothetical protein
MSDLLASAVIISNEVQRSTWCGGRREMARELLPMLRDIASTTFDHNARETARAAIAKIEKELG